MKGASWAFLWVLTIITTALITLYLVGFSIDDLSIILAITSILLAIFSIIFGIWSHVRTEESGAKHKNEIIEILQLILRKEKLEKKAESSNKPEERERLRGEIHDINNKILRKGASIKLPITPEFSEAIKKYKNIISEMELKGYSEEQITQILTGNLLTNLNIKKIVQDYKQSNK